MGYRIRTKIEEFISLISFVFLSIEAVLLLCFFVDKIWVIILWKWYAILFFKKKEHFDGQKVKLFKIFYIENLIQGQIIFLYFIISNYLTSNLM